MRKICIFTGFFLMISILCNGQNYFRSGIFLHHSTGACIWGPNGSNTSIPDEMSSFNMLHGYTGVQAVTMNEEWWAPDNNEWVTQHDFFENTSPVTGIGFYLPGNKIIVIKSCFPSSSMVGAGQPSDTLNPELKTVYNYKWHWRHIVRVMNQHRENFFVIWTNAPLEPGSTNASEAALSKWFCTWAKDTLATGLDPDLGVFPPNIYVFDFFRKLTSPDGMMRSMYAAGSGDSHPNAAATALVAPQFVTEIFDASLAYESTLAIHESDKKENAGISVFPNPCQNEAALSFILSDNQKVTISLFERSGKIMQKIIDKPLLKGTHIIPVSLERLSQGVYSVVFVHGRSVEIAKLVVVR